MGFFSAVYDFFFNIIYAFSNSFYLSIIKSSRYMMLVRGLAVSIEITVIACVIGVVLGILLAICRIKGKGALYTFASAYISVIRGTPMVVQLIIVYYIILQDALPPIVSASFAFGLNSAAYVAEIIRSGIQSIDRGQTEAGRSLGLNNRQTMLSIILPQAVKNVLPALGNEFIVLLKETSIAGYIAITDVNKASMQIIAGTYDAYFAPLFVAYLYFVLTTTLAAGVNKFERRLKRSD